MEAESVRTKLRPKPSTSVSMRDSWWEDRISYGFVSEVCLEFLENQTLGVSEIFRCPCFWEESLE